MPTVLIPGLMCSPRFYAAPLPALWRHGPVMVADHTRHDNMADIARALLAEAPPRFALAGHSMGGYIALEVMRQAPERVTRLALLDTAAPADTPEQTERRRGFIQLARDGRFSTIVGLIFPLTVDPSAAGRRELLEVQQAMAEETGPEAFVRQQTAIMGRIDSRPHLHAIRCPTLVVVGDSDQLTPPERSRELAAGISGARLVVLERCGHMCALEQPERVTRELLAWLGD
jgi:pimeloyl-ACP methyl ester carboxylesterase